MNISEFVQKMTKDFLIIFALIILILTILRQIYAPELAFDLRSIYIIMSFSFLAAIMGFIFYSSHDLSEKNMRIRRMIHFLALETLLIALSYEFDLVQSGLDAVILAVQIAVIYIIVRLLSWQKDKKEARIMNEKLRDLKERRV